MIQESQQSTASRPREHALDVAKAALRYILPCGLQGVPYHLVEDVGASVPPGCKTAIGGKGACRACAPKHNSIATIAKAVGFSSTSYFRSVFLKYEGKKPESCKAS